MSGLILSAGNHHSQGGPAICKSIARKKAVIVPFDLSPEELQYFYAFVEALAEAILQKPEEPKAPPIKPALRLVKSSSDTLAVSSAPR